MLRLSYVRAHRCNPPKEATDVATNAAWTLVVATPIHLPPSVHYGAVPALHPQNAACAAWHIVMQCIS